MCSCTLRVIVNIMQMFDGDKDSGLFHSSPDGDALGSPSAQVGAQMSLPYWDCNFESRLLLPVEAPVDYRVKV